MAAPGKKDAHDKFQQHRSFLAPDPNRKLGENIKQNLGQNVGIYKGRDLGWGGPHERQKSPKLDILISMPAARRQKTTA